MDQITPAQTTELVSRTGAKKARMRIDKMFINSFMGGPLLGFGCALLLSTNSSAWFQTNAPGLIKTIAASFFPIGLIMVILTGADSFTSYVLFSTVALLHRRISVLVLFKTWFVSFFGNLAGMLFFMAALTGYGGTFSTGYYHTKLLNFATTKVVTPGWHQIFLRDILANWLVTMAVFLSISSREIISKIVSIWFPVMCVVALGADHVIANMFFIPMAIFEGSPNISVSYYIWKSMIPSALGNIVGGGLFVRVVYWYLYLEGMEVEIHFDEKLVDSAVCEQGGPASRNASIAQVPDSMGTAQSGIAKDLNGSHFKKETNDSDASTAV